MTDETAITSTPPTPYWLKGIRTRAGMSQVAFAERLGITPRQLINLEAGRSAIRPPLVHLARAVDAETEAAAARPHTNDILIF